MTLAERVNFVNFKLDTDLLTPAILRMEYKREGFRVKKLITTKQNPDRRQQLLDEDRERYISYK